MFYFSQNGVTLETILDTSSPANDGKYTIIIKITYHSSQKFYSTGNQVSSDEWQKLATDISLSRIKCNILNSFEKIKETIQILETTDHFDLDGHLEGSLYNLNRATEDGSIQKNLTDIKLWTDFRDGDNESLSKIFNEYSQKLFSYGLKLTNNHLIIEDSIQELFSDLIRKRKTLGDTNNIQFYLIKSFKRKLVRLLQREKKYTFNEAGEEYFEVTYSIEQDIIVEESFKQKAILLQRALKSLSPRQKEAIYLKFTEELEYEEIAEMLDMSVESCRNLIYRAIKALKESLNINGALILFFLHHLKKSFQK